MLNTYLGARIGLIAMTQVNALQRRSLERELHILNRIRHGAIIRAGAIVEEDDGADNPIPMLYIEVSVLFDTVVVARGFWLHFGLDFGYVRGCCGARGVLR